MMNGNWRTRGDIAPWALGVTLGLLLGIALLIFTNATATPPAEEGAEATPAVEMAEGTQSAGESETMTNDSPAGADVGSEETTASGGAGDDGDEDASEAEAQGEAGELAQAGEVAAADPTDPQPAAVSEAADDTEALETPAVAAADADADAGKQVFAGNGCAGCHGADAGGGLGPSLQGLGNDWSVTDLATALRDGVTPTGETLGGAMPKFSAEQIGDQDVANLHAWLATQ